MRLECLSQAAKTVVLSKSSLLTGCFCGHSVTIKGTTYKRGQLVVLSPLSASDVCPLNTYSLVFGQIDLVLQAKCDSFYFLGDEFVFKYNHDLHLHVLHQTDVKNV